MSNVRSVLPILMANEGNLKNFILKNCKIPTASGLGPNQLKFLNFFFKENKWSFSDNLGPKWQI